MAEVYLIQCASYRRMRGVWHDREKHEMPWCSITFPRTLSLVPHLWVALCSLSLMHATCPGKFDYTTIAIVHIIKSHDKTTVMFKLKQLNELTKIHNTIGWISLRNVIANSKQSYAIALCWSNHFSIRTHSWPPWWHFPRRCTTKILKIFPISPFHSHDVQPRVSFFIRLCDI
jgi:hypothetical protein